MRSDSLAHLVVILAFSILIASSPSPVLAQPADDFAPVTDAMLENPADEDWLTWRRTTDGWGYSPLDEITSENVGALRMVWTRAMAPGRMEGTPLAYDGVLFMPQSDDVIEAIDGVTGDLRWSYRRDLPDDVYDMVGGNARTNRNVAIYDRLIVNTTDDDFAIGIDATTGEVVWETKIFDYQVNPAGHSAGPIIADGKMISGRSCRPMGGPETCVVIAHDARTGEELWRRSTVALPGEPGDETWGGVPYEQRIHVGSWMPASYDPELRLIYQGTSVTSPAPKFMLGGVENTHLYHNSTLALDVDTGEIRWHYQHLNDHWDLDHPFERILVDTAVAPDPTEVSWINPRLRPGEMRKVITGIPGKTGVVYTLDRETGEFLWATPTITQNVISGIDGATGVVSTNSEVVFTQSGTAGVRLSNLERGQGLGGGRLQPVDEHDVHAAAANVRSDDGRHGVRRPTERAQRESRGDLRDRLPASDCAGDGERRHHSGDLGRDGRDRVALRAAGGHHVAGGHRRAAAVRGGHQRPVPGVQPGDGRDSLGDQPRLTGVRVPHQLRGRRAAVHRGRHGVGRHRLTLHGADPGAAPQLGQQPVRVRLARPTVRQMQHALNDVVAEARQRPMALTVGACLGHYDVAALIGEGGIPS